jgi:ABC-type antimicrobial peptide transport system permease subunit
LIFLQSKIKEKYAKVIYNELFFVAVIIQYLKTAWYNIRHNKGYAVFCTAGTALTFIFVVLVLQMVYIFTVNYPPMTNADRIIRLESFQDTEGKILEGEIRYTSTNAFLENLKEFSHVSFFHQNLVNVIVEGQLYPAWTTFANADFWKIYDFDFLYGRPFTSEECTTRRPVAVITEDMSRSFFQTKNSTGKKITFQSNEYEIIGVVRNISYFSTPVGESTVWVPHVFDKFIPNGTYTYTIDMLVPPSMSMDESTERISRAVNYYFENKNIRVDFPPQKAKTVKETLTKEGDMFQYGSVVAFVLFLLIPALNILSLSRAHTNNRAGEIAIQRAFGASRLQSFLQIMTENFLLVAVGSITGLLLAMPAMNTVQQLITGDSVMENISITGQIDYGVIFAGVLPSMFVFSLLSGGVPAYLISKRNIAHVLKGGTK